MRVFSRWIAAPLQDRLVGIVLAMAVVTALIAAPFSIKTPAVAPIVMEGFAILLVAALLCAAKWDLRPAALKANLRSGTGLAAIALVGITLLSCLASRDRAISLQ